VYGRVGVVLLTKPGMPLDEFTIIIIIFLVLKINKKVTCVRTFSLGQVESDLAYFCKIKK